VLAAWALAPALLAVAAGLLEPRAYDWPTTALGQAFAIIALLGGPFILYGWSAHVLRHKRVKEWALEALTLTMGMCCVNGLAAFVGYSLINSFLLP
jgi:integral membrane sensor domain MASE1